MLRLKKSITNIVDLNFIKCKKHSIETINYLIIYINYKYRQKSTLNKVKTETKIIELLYNSLKAYVVAFKRVLFSTINSMLRFQRRCFFVLFEIDFNVIILL